jgi:hypothetical protein
MGIEIPRRGLRHRASFRPICRGGLQCVCRHATRRAPNAFRPESAASRKTFAQALIARRLSRAALQSPFVCRFGPHQTHLTYSTNQTNPTNQTDLTHQSDPTDQTHQTHQT